MRIVRNEMDMYSQLKIQYGIENREQIYISKHNNSECNDYEGSLSRAGDELPSEAHCISDEMKR